VQVNIVIVHTPLDLIFDLVIMNLCFLLLQRLLTFVALFWLWLGGLYYNFKLFAWWILRLSPTFIKWCNSYYVWCWNCRGVFIWVFWAILCNEIYCMSQFCRGTTRSLGVHWCMRITLSVTMYMIRMLRLGWSLCRCFLSTFKSVCRDI
jgi:hypothetical protein